MGTLILRPSCLTGEPTVGRARGSEERSWEGVGFVTDSRAAALKPLDWKWGEGKDGGEGGEGWRGGRGGGGGKRWPDESVQYLFWRRREQKPTALPANQKQGGKPRSLRCRGQICSSCTAHRGFAPCCSRSERSGSLGELPQLTFPCCSQRMTVHCCGTLRRMWGPVDLPPQQRSFSHLNPNTSEEEEEEWVPPRCRRRCRWRKSPRRRWKATTTSYRPAPSWRALCSVSKCHADQYLSATPTG